MRILREQYNKAASCQANRRCIHVCLAEQCVDLSRIWLCYSQEPFRWLDINDFLTLNHVHDIEILTMGFTKRIFSGMCFIAVEQQE